MTTPLASLRFAERGFAALGTTRAREAREQNQGSGERQRAATGVRGHRSSAGREPPEQRTGPRE